MMDIKRTKIKQLKQFHEQAREILKLNPPPKQTVSYEEVHEILEQNEVYKIEIELQNNELHNAILRCEEERNRYSTLFDFIPFGCFILDQHGVIIDTNEIGANLIGVKKSNLLNKNLLRYIAANYQNSCINYLQQTINSSELLSCEVKLLRKNGPMLYVLLDSKAMYNSITEETYILSFVKDINEKRQNENYIHESQKRLAMNERNNSMGEFADIISHELNHPLAVITNYVHGCIRRLETGKFKVDEVIEALKKAGDQSHRINEIILRMKNFTCKGSLNYESSDINILINETITLINHEHLTFPTNIHYYPIQNSPVLMLDKIHIQQVIINIARNAIEAMKDAGCSDPKLFIEAYYFDQDKIEINIIDNGPGIPLDNLHKLFSPYFTTKPYGIGLGLAVSRKIIEAHGGNLSAEKHPLGTCFKFTLLTKPLSHDLVHQFSST